MKWVFKSGNWRSSINRVTAGKTNKVNIVAVIKPPITTIAGGFCTSAPVPVAIAIGTKPNDGTMAVIRMDL